MTIVEATTYTVSLLPFDHIDSGIFSITVEKRSEGRWAVLHHSWCLGADGEWDYEMQPSSREDDWLATHRFDLDTAIALAKKAAPDLTVNGRSAGSVAEAHRDKMAKEAGA